MFLHQHPYPPFIKDDTTKLIVGTLPPPRFSVGDLLEKDVDFCYGSYYNSLWLYIDAIHNLGLNYDNSEEAVEERKQFLVDNRIGVCDIVESAEREKVDASDLGMNNVILRDLIGHLHAYPNIDTLVFTGGNSKNGPEYLFRKHLKDYNLKLSLISNEVPRIHEFILPEISRLPLQTDTKLSHRMESNLSYRGEPRLSHRAESRLSLRTDANLVHRVNPGLEHIGESKVSQPTDSNLRIIKTVSLTSASGSANRAIGSMPLYQQLKAKNPNFSTFDFRVMQYREFL